MRVLDELKDYLLTQADVDADNPVFAHIDAFAENEEKKYEALRKDKKLSFGRYRGYTVKELSVSEKGREYLGWLVSQTWFIQKNQHLVDEINELGIKPKKYKRTPLE